jgi:GH24 family phage-related lysozyme (muramidase)
VTVDPITYDTLFCSTLPIIPQVLQETTRIVEEPIKPQPAPKKIASTTYDVYAAWMWYMKTREGFIDHNYTCPAGYNTIGYGHNLDACNKNCYHHKFTNGKSITYQNATALLSMDIEALMPEIKANFPGLRKEQYLAIMSLGLNIGFYKLLWKGGKKKNGRATFYKLVKAGKVPNFMAYTNYKNTKGKRVISPNLQRSRKFELAMYTGNWDLVKTQAKYYQNIIVTRDIRPAKARGKY